MRLNWWNKIGTLVRWFTGTRVREYQSTRVPEYQSTIVLFCCFTIFGLGCSSSKPSWEYMPDMMDQPSLKAQKHDPHLPHHRVMLNPVPGTIPRNYQPYSYEEDPEGAGKNLKNPLPRTREVFTRGKKVYETYCSVCHGERGLGNGVTVPPFPPITLHSEKVRAWSDGRIYHVITMGQNMMPSYASQITQEKRWAAIHYLRALQRAENPLPKDFEAYKKFRLKERIKE